MQFAARVRVDPIILVTHVIERRPMPLDEQQLVEIQERIGERNPATQLADLLEQRVTRVTLSRVEVFPCLAEFGEFGSQRRKVIGASQSLQVGQQGFRAAQDHVGWIPVCVVDQCGGVVGLGRHAGEVFASSQVAQQGGMLALALVFPRAVGVVPGRAGGWTGAELDPVHQQTQAGSRSPTLSTDFRQGPETHVLPGYLGGKQHHIFAVLMRERACHHQRARLVVGLAHVELIAGDGSIPAAGARQIGKSADLVGRAQIDCEFVRVGRVVELPIGMPQRVGIAVHGPVTLVAWRLAVGANGDQNRIGAGHGAQRNCAGSPSDHHPEYGLKRHRTFSRRTAAAETALFVWREDCPKVGACSSNTQ
jgi:hypothetical protein